MNKYFHWYKWIVIYKNNLKVKMAVMQKKTD